mmetsp:Transcript_4369/g.10559  ORF Transcript_4369/g.10559 Transcript_4369/m.10559 type:complete len:250 (-) Transcript_4369:1069-1818(-)
MQWQPDWRNGERRNSHFLQRSAHLRRLRLSGWIVKTSRQYRCVALIVRRRSGIVWLLRMCSHVVLQKPGRPLSGQSLLSGRSRHCGRSVAGRHGNQRLWLAKMLSLHDAAHSSRLTRLQPQPQQLQGPLQLPLRRNAEERERRLLKQKHSAKLQRRSGCSSTAGKRWRSRISSADCARTTMQRSLRSVVGRCRLLIKRRPRSCCARLRKQSLPGCSRKTYEHMLRAVRKDDWTLSALLNNVVQRSKPPL